MARPEQAETARTRQSGPTVVCKCGAIVSDRSRWARRAIVAFSVLLLCGIGLITVNDPVAPDPLPAVSVLTPPEQDYVNRVNVLRGSRGLNALTVDDNMEDLARGHTHDMVVRQELHHTPDLFGGVSVSWQKLGENVGFGSNTATVWAAFVASPPHLENLVDPSFDRIGVGVEVDPSGLQWTTHRFLQTKSVPATPPSTMQLPTTPSPTVTIARPTTAPPPSRPPTTRAATTGLASTTAAEPEATTSMAVAPTSDPLPPTGTAPPDSTVGSGAVPAAAPAVTPETEAYSATSLDDWVRWARSTILVMLLIGAAVLSDHFIRAHPNVVIAGHRHRERSRQDARRRRGTGS